MSETLVPPPSPPRSSGDGKALVLEKVTRVFGMGEQSLRVLRGIDLSLEEGQIVALVGPSGAGKSTLLHIAGLLEQPTSGKVLIGGRDCAELGDAERTRYRQTTIGFVYQFHHLLPEFSARENVMIPQMIAGLSRKEAGIRADQLLNMVGLSERASHRPARLSGGEQQRVAIARAFVAAPRLVLADEPTGNLDQRTGEIVIRTMFDLARESGTALLLVTHDPALAARCDRTLVIEGGRVAS